MASTLKKEWKLTSSDQKLEKLILQENKVAPFIAKILAQSDLASSQAVEAFLEPSLAQLHDPFLMKGMKLAVDRLEKAIEAGENILLYGDYDVDGTTSVALMHQFLDSIGVQTNYYIPDRYKEGYGISRQGIKYAHEQKYTLIIAMDCGIRAHDTTRLANNYGIDLIICDHHLPEEKLPEAYAILDPLQKDCPYPFKYLSGCGVTFKFVQAYCQRRNISDKHWSILLDYLVISIAADIVPMVGENRVLAYFGLKLLDQTTRPGLLALLKINKRVAPLTITDVVFGMAPMINAAGRMAQASLAVSLLLSKEEETALTGVKKLDYQNKLRREFEQRITEEAKQLFLQQENREEVSSIVLYQAHWHKGVVGIVASRLVETFHKPTIILTESEGKIVGSARSVRGFDIHEAIRHCEGLLMNYGGHKYAAGLTLKSENLDAFRDRFEGFVQTHITPEQSTPIIEYASEIDLADINEDLFETLKTLAPFGPHNKNPVFITKNVIDTGYSKVLKEKHLKLNLKQKNSRGLSAMAFFMSDYAEQIFTRTPFDICYTLQQNKWQGRVTWQLMIKDLKLPNT